MRWALLPHFAETEIGWVVCPRSHSLAYPGSPNQIIFAAHLGLLLAQDTGSLVDLTILQMCIWHFHIQVVLVVKNWSANVGDVKRYGFDPWVRKIRWSRKWQPTPVFLPGKSHGQRSLEGYSPLGHKESNTTYSFTCPIHQRTGPIWHSQWSGAYYPQILSSVAEGTVS